VELANNVETNGRSLTNFQEDGLRQSRVSASLGNAKGTASSPSPEPTGSSTRVRFSREDVLFRECGLG
jgi:hypothetical protein